MFRAIILLEFLRSIVNLTTCDFPFSSYSNTLTSSEFKIALIPFSLRLNKINYSKFFIILNKFKSLKIHKFHLDTSSGKVLGDISPAILDIIIFFASSNLVVWPSVHIIFTNAVSGSMSFNGKTPNLRRSRPVV